MKTGKHDSVSFFASFKRSDQISGTVTVHKEVFNLGKSFKVPYSRLNLVDVTNN